MNKYKIVSKGWRIHFSKMSIAVFLLLSTTCFAAVESAGVFYFSGAPNFNQSASFAMFDTMDGTRQLTAINVTLHIEVAGGSFFLDNDGVDPASVDYDFGAIVSISSVDVPLLDSSYMPVLESVEATTQGTINLGGDDGDLGAVWNGLDYNGSDGQSSGSLALDVTTDVSGSISSSLFSLFTGTGSYDVNINAVQWIEFIGIGGVQYSVNPTSISNLILEIEYVYDVIPEPLTLSLMGLGGLLIRRRK